MSVASTPWASRTTARPPTRPMIWPVFAALGLFLMGVGATLGGIGHTSPASSRTASPLTLAAAHQQGQAIAGQLAAIEPGIAAMPLERIGSAAAATCGDLRESIPDADMAVRTVARFGGSGYALTNRQADQIVAAVKTSYCGSLPTPP